MKLLTTAKLMPAPSSAGRLEALDPSRRAAMQATLAGRGAEVATAASSAALKGKVPVAYSAQGAGLDANPPVRCVDSAGGNSGKGGRNNLYSSSKFCRNYIRKLVYLFVFFAISTVIAGSYEDFFSAVRADDPDGITRLIRQGFDANVRDPKGEHALHQASRENAARAIAALLRWEKIDVEPRNKADESPLMLAAIGGHLETVKMLIARGADVNKTGWAPLHYAATRGHLDVMRLLLDQNAYIDAASPNGTTPLMMAAHYGTASAVKLLLEAGADPMLKNQQQLTAIDFAQRGKRADAAEVIAAFVRARQPRGKW